MVELSKEKPNWLGNGEHWEARMGEIIDMLRAVGKRRKEEVNVSYEQGDARKIAKLDAVVRIGDRPDIAVEVRERDDWKKNGKRVGMRMLAAGGSKSIGYYLVALSGGAILYTRSQLEEFMAGRCKIDAVRLDEVIDKLEYELFGVPAKNISTAQAENYLKSSLKDCKNLSEETRKAIEKVKIKKVENSSGSSNYYLDDETERKLILALLGGQMIRKVSKYTSLDSFKRMVDERKLSLCSIVGMNDKSECSYASDYIREQSDNINRVDFMDESNSSFVMSCVEATRNDDLTMWRLYGDDGRGVCLTFNKKGWNAKKQGLESVFAKVSYARANGTHPELDYIIKLLNGSTKNGHKMKLQCIDIWKHFFKPYEYATENEIRLFIRKSNDNKELENKIKWIKTYNDGIICPLISFDFTDDKKDQFQFELESVILGPKCPESDINVVQLKRYIESQKLNVSPKFEVKKSNIKTYR